MHANSRDLGSPLSNISKPRSTAVCVKRDGSSLRGRGGLVSSRAHVSKEINAETAPSPEKDSIPLSQETNFDLVPSLVSEPEIGMFPDVCLVPTSKGSQVPRVQRLLTHLLSLSLLPCPRVKR